MTQYSQEKKHVFFEFRNPTASIELHAGSKDVAEAIITILGDLKGADEAKGLKEVARASLAKASSLNKRIGVLLYDFASQGSDELSCREGEEVYIVDLNKSKEWWMCERISDGRQGVVPSSYIEIVGTTNLDKLTDGVLRRKSEKSSKGKIISNNSSSRRKLHHYNRDERERIRESDRVRRDHSKSTKKDDKSMPNYHRVRTWIDSSGSFKVEAEFLGCVEGKIHLHKTNGVKIAVAATKLSIEDLEYVEKVTGTSLEGYKEEVARHSAKKKHSSSHHNDNVSPIKESRGSGVSVTSTPQGESRSATAAINDIPPAQPTRPKATTAISASEPDYDWFEFFLQCGVDIGNCQRYSINFSKEQMDETVLEDITPSLLRSLGLREGDILRVMKFLDNKFDRKKTTAADAPSGGLFTEATGALKNNSTAELSKVSASALPDPSPQKAPQAPLANNAGRFEDDAWAVKPAARSAEDVSLPSSRPQYTGSLQDLVDIKPLETNPQTPQRDVLLQTPAGTPSAPALTPVKTGPLTPYNPTGNASATPLKAISTGGFGQPNLVPVQTGGLMPAQPTGFVAINSQPTGFVPIQPTGGIIPQLTIGIVPLQTGVSTFAPPMGAQKTGEPLAGPPPTTFGQIPMQPTNSFVPLQPGNVTMPATSFNQTLTGNGFQPSLTGNAFPGNSSSAQVTGGVTGQATGGLSGQATGGAIKSTFVPQSAFGRQITGGFMPQPSQQTGGMPTTSFGQLTGGMPTTSFGQQTGGMPITSFGQQTGGMPITSFSQQTGGMPSTSFGQQTGGMPSFGQQTGGMPNFGQQTGGMVPNGFNQKMPNNFNQSTPFGQQTGGFMPNYGQQTGGTNTFSQPGATNFGQPPTSFGQPGSNNFGLPSMPPTSFGQPNVNQVTNMFQNTSIGGQYAGQNPTFGNQPQFEGFGQQLQSQPTGAGFGNGPSLQAQPTGRRANLQTATADNPFGF